MPTGVQLRVSPLQRLGLAWACPLVEFVAAGQKCTILTGVALCRGHVADTAMAVRFVVPMDEEHCPASRGIKTGEAAGRELGAIFVLIPSQRSMASTVVALSAAP